MDDAARPNTVLSSGVLFDPYKRAVRPELRDALHQLTVELEAAEKAFGLRKRTRAAADRVKLRGAVEALVCNLLILRMLRIDRPLAVPKSSGVMWSKDRYASPVYGQHFLDALEAMSRPEIGWIEAVATGFRFSSGASRRSTIRATPRLFAALSAPVDGWSAFRNETPAEVLILKGARTEDGGAAPTIDYKENTKTKALRNRVKRINSRLSVASIFVACDTPDMGLDSAGQPVDPTRRTVRRIFNNGKWTEGGRLFDGFWETMRRDDRFRLLRIGTDECPEGEPVANVDYGQLFPRLAYLFDGIEAPTTDIYDVFGNGEHRGGVKRLFNALLFHKGPLTRWPRDTRPLFPQTVSLRQATTAIFERHAPIAHHFGTAIGFRLMFAESEVLMMVLEDLATRGITALPLHDSVLVARSKAEETRAILEAAFQNHLHQEVRAMVSIDLGPENVGL